MDESTDTRARVLALFEQHRATPGAPYDEAWFVDFLLADPPRRHAVRNSFGGLRRFNAFVEALQLEFAICLSVADREKSRSLDAFVRRIDELRASPRASRASFRNQALRDNGVTQFLVLTVFGLGVAAVAWRQLPALGIVVAASAVALLVLMLRCRRHDRRYRRRLAARLDEQAAGSPMQAEAQR